MTSSGLWIKSSMVDFLGDLIGFTSQTGSALTWEFTDRKEATIKIDCRGRAKVNLDNIFAKRVDDNLTPKIQDVEQQNKV